MTKNCLAGCTGGLVLFVLSPLAFSFDVPLDMLQDNTDGVVGIYLKRVNGPVGGAVNSSTQFEPASSVKVLVHTHGMLRVQNGTVDLTDNVPWTADITKFNMGIYQPGGGDCPTNNTVPQSTSMQQALRWTMENSDNALTQALRDLFTDLSITGTRLNLGMFDTVLDHSIGCGDEAVLFPNRTTLEDLGSLYEQTATGGLFVEPHLGNFRDFMTNGPAQSLSDAIAEEAAKQGKANLATDFENLMMLASKGGSYTIGGTGVEYRSRAGWASMPTDFGAGSREFVYGAFVDNATTLDQQGTGVNLSINDVVTEILRPVIRGIFLTWKVLGLTNPDLDDGKDTLSDLKADSTGSPLPGILDLAIAELDSAQDFLDRPSSDYVGALNEIRDAALHIEGAIIDGYLRDDGNDSSTHANDALRIINELGFNRALDAYSVALAFGDGSTFQTDLEAAEQEIIEGEQLFDRVDTGAGVGNLVLAIDEYIAAATMAAALVPDRDVDGVPDFQDNCLDIANPDQRDTNADGFGNICDPDVDNDGTVEFPDLNAMKLGFFATPGDPEWDPDLDFDGDDSVEFPDLNTMKLYFFDPPGPSGTVGP